MPRQLDAPHQIFWHDNNLYITEAGGADRVSVWGEGELVTRYSGQSGSHINSIWRSDQAWYVVEHRWHKKPKYIQSFSLGFRPEHRYEIDLVGAEMPGIHNVYAEDGWLYTLSAGAMLKKETAGSPTRTVFATDSSCYLRGLARTEDLWYVGVSDHADRKDRSRGDSSIFVLDNGIRVVSRIHLGGTGQLCDIRALEGDRAHNGIDLTI
jgi:hypothetical protein